MPREKGTSDAEIHTELVEGEFTDREIDSWIISIYHIGEEWKKEENF